MTRALLFGAAMLAMLGGCGSSAALDAEADRQLQATMDLQNHLRASDLSRYDFNDVRVIDDRPKRFGRHFVSCAMATPIDDDGAPTGPERRALIVGGAPAFDGPKQGPWFDHLWKKLNCPG